MRDVLFGFRIEKIPGCSVLFVSLVMVRYKRTIGILVLPVLAFTIICLLVVVAIKLEQH